MTARWTVLGSRHRCASRRGSSWILAVAVTVVGCGSADTSARPPGATAAAKLPEACSPDRPETQSPAIFGEGGIQPDKAESCDVEGSPWILCHQHMHCGPEHAGGGICRGADCEIHTVYRRRKDDGETVAVPDAHRGSVSESCEPAEHHLLVLAAFVDFDMMCEWSAGSTLTYCGSATGNSMLDANKDGVVSCTESGVNSVPVRWCIQTACECRPGGTVGALSSTLGEREPPRGRGCPNAAP